MTSSPSLPWRSSRDLPVLCLIILMGAALRAAYLNEALRGDEIWTLEAFIQQPLSVGLSHYWSTNNHLFNTLLTHIAWVLFGNDPALLRLPAYFAGVLIIPATYRVGRAFYNSATGLLAATLVAASAVLTSFATSARGFSLIVLITLLLLLLAERLIRQPERNRRLWIAFGLLVTVGLYTVPTLVYGLAVVGAWFVVAVWTQLQRHQRLWSLRNLVLTLIGAGLLTAVLYLPAVIYLRTEVDGPRDFSHLQPIPYDIFVSYAAREVPPIYFAWTRGMPLPIEFVLIGGTLIALLASLRNACRRAPLFLIAALVSVALVFLYPVLIIPRVWLFLLPIWWMTAAAGVVLLVQRGMRVLRRPVPRAAGLIAIVALGVWLVVAVVQTRAVRRIVDNANFYVDSRDILAYVQARNQPGDVLLCEVSCLAILNYYQRLRGEEPRPFLLHFDPEQPPDHLLLILHYGSGEPDRALKQEQIFANADVDASRYSWPLEIQRFPNAILYQMDLLS